MMGSNVSCIIKKCRYRYSFLSLSPFHNYSQQGILCKNFAVFKHESVRRLYCKNVLDILNCLIVMPFLFKIRGPEL